MNSIGTRGERTEADSGPARYTWKFPGASVRIRISLEAIRAIREYLTTHAEADSNSEAGGLLLGRPHPPSVEIDSFAPVKSGQRFVFSEAQKRDLRKQVEDEKQRGGELSVVGYFRSDCRSGICLDEEDLSLINDVFPNRTNVFLVLHSPDRINWSAGFFFTENGDIFTSCSFMEFEFDEQSLAASAGVDNPIDEPGNELSPYAPPMSDVRNEQFSNPAGLRRWFVAGAIAIVLVLGLGTYVAISRPDNSRQVTSATGARSTEDRLPSPLGLTASRSGPDLSISWNGQASLVANARVGMLTIEDGGSKRDLPLTQAQLQSSRLIYRPQMDTVQVALEIFANDGKITRENVIAVLNTVPQAAPAQEPRAVQVQIPVDRDELRRAAPDIQERQRRPVNEFIPPAFQKTPAASAAVTLEPPPTVTVPVEMQRMDPPLAQRSGITVLPPARQGTTTVPAQPMQQPLQQPVQEQAQPAQIVSQPQQPPIPTRQVRPVLPQNVKAMLTRRANVKVRVQVDATGKVTGAEPLAVNGSLERFLGSAAVSAARLWAFEPATTGGRKVPGEVTLDFAFVPDNSKF